MNSSSSDFKKIIKFSGVFHIILILGITMFYYLFKSDPKAPEPIWVELVNLNEPLAQPKPTPIKEEIEEVVEEEVVEEKVEEVVEDIPPEPVIKPKPIAPPKKATPPKKVEKPVVDKVVEKKETPTPPKKETPNWDVPDFDAVQSKQVLARVTDSYTSRVVMAMSRYWNPPIGLNLSKNAVAKFEIVIIKDGTISSYRLTESSGSELIDQKAELALKSAKLPPMPPQMGESWTLIYGFKYDTQ